MGVNITTIVYLRVLIIQIGSTIILMVVESQGKYFTQPYVEWCLGSGENFFLVQIHIGKAVLWHFFKPFREKTPIDIRTLAKYPPEACVCTYGLGLEKFE